MTDTLVERVVARLNGFVQCGCCDEEWPQLRHDTVHLIDAQASRIAELEAERDTPEVVDFAKAVQLEAWHQRYRWGASHDVGKAPLDWFWLIGYLSQKAATAQIAGDMEKALHHTISTAAALANWHLAISGTDNRMRPGIEEPDTSKALGDKA